MCMWRTGNSQPAARERISFLTAVQGASVYRFTSVSAGRTKKERGIKQHDDVHDHMRYIKPIGEIMFMFDSPRSLPACVEETRAVQGALDRASPASTKNSRRGAVDETHQDQSIGTPKAVHSKAEQT